MLLAFGRLSARPAISGSDGGSSITSWCGPRILPVLPSFAALANPKEHLLRPGLCSFELACSQLAKCDDDRGLLPEIHNALSLHWQTRLCEGTEQVVVDCTGISGRGLN